MSDIVSVGQKDEEVTALKLAREIAMSFNEIEDILKNHDISADRYAELQKNPYFQALVRSEVEAWTAATNTSERVKLKAAAMLEQWLPEAYARAHDRTEGLSAKVELMKLIKSLTGFGVSAAEGGGERLSVTINLGADSTLKYEKTIAPPIIEGELAK